MDELIITDFSRNDRTITAAEATPNIPTMPPVYAVSAYDVIENMEAELDLCNKALDDVNIVGTAHLIYSRVAEMLREQIEFVKGLPQVEPEPRTGKWIVHQPFDNGHKNCNICIECSSCNTWFGHDCYAKTNFCPKCGAKMEDEQCQDITCNTLPQENGGVSQA